MPLIGSPCIRTPQIIMRISVSFERELPRKPSLNPRDLTILLTLSLLHHSIFFLGPKKEKKKNVFAAPEVW
jgi:hypothetical protein